MKSYINYLIYKYKSHSVFTVGYLVDYITCRGYNGVKKNNKGISCFAVDDCGSFFKFTYICSGEKKIIKLYESKYNYFIYSDFFDFDVDSKVYMRKCFGNCIEISDRQVGVECVRLDNEFAVSCVNDFKRGRYYLFKMNGSYLMVPYGFKGFSIITYMATGSNIYIDDIVDQCVFKIDDEDSIRFVFEESTPGWFGILKKGVENV